MKAWILESLGGSFSLTDVEAPSAPRGGVVVDMRATPLLSYLGKFVRGELPTYAPVTTPFTPGTNGVGVVSAVGEGVYHYREGDRVAVNPLLVANEAVANPAQILIGLTQISPDAGPVMEDWPSGTLREQAVFPASSLVPLSNLDDVPDERAATLGKFIVPYGGLRRGNLSPGEVLVVHGATGYFGSAAVMLGLALGASRVIAAGRNQAVLEQLSAIGGDRVVPAAMQGDIEKDVATLRELSGGGADMAFDIVGRAGSPNGTLASLKSLRRGGRLVVMGSLEPALPIDYNEVMLNDWSITGQFMYDREAYPSLLKLVAGGMLDLGAVNVATYALADLPNAIEAAANMGGLDCTVITI